MKQKLGITVLLLGLLVAQVRAKRIYVAPTAKNGNGSSWSKAANNLKNVLDSASGGDIIWVAEGTYYPTSTGNRKIAFHIREGITLLGGFQKGASALTQRDWQKYPSILSGNIGDKTDSTDNSYNIMTTSSATFGYRGVAWIDGFEFTGGHADSLHSFTIHGEGGAVHFHTVAPRFSNCSFYNNYALLGGALGGGGGSSYYNCAFFNNRALSAGAVNIYWGNFYYCSFNNNHASQYYGALHALGGYVENCSFTNNSAGREGGALNGGIQRLIDCYFENNKTTDVKNGNGGAVYLGTGSRDNLVRGCTFVSNTASGKGGAIYAYNNSQTLKDSVVFCGNTFISNTSGNQGGAIYSRGGTFFMTNSVFIHNKSTQEGSVIYQTNKYYHASNEYKNCSFYGNKSDSNYSFYFYNSSGNTAPTLSNCILHDNDSIPFKTPITSIYKRSNFRIKRCIIDFDFPAKDTIRSSPQFINPKGDDNISGTSDDHLQVLDRSPAINRGLDTTFPTPCGSYNDVAGNRRIYKDTIDIGAYEKAACPTIKRPAVVLTNTMACINDTVMVVDNVSNGAATYWEVVGQALTDPQRFNDTLWLPLNETGTIEVKRIATLCDSTIATTRTILVRPYTQTPSITNTPTGTWCEGDTVKLAADTIYQRYEWSTSATTDTITIKNTATVGLRVKKAGACWSEKFSKTFKFIKPPSAPTISYARHQACFDDSIKVASAGSYVSYQWNHGPSTDSTYISSTGTYALRVSNSSGCRSKWSSPVVIVIYDEPKKPRIIYDTLKACEGQTIQLRTNKQYPTVEWSNLSNTDSVLLSIQGNYHYHYVDKNGCKSAASDTAILEFLKPPLPNILWNERQFCQGDSISISGPANMLEYKWSTGQRGRQIWVDESMTLYLSVKDSFCESSQQDNVQIIEHPNPKAHVEILDNDSFCSGKSIHLRTINPHTTYEWSQGYKNRKAEITVGGEYSVRVTNSYNCYSDWSDTVVVTELPLPSRPVISLDTDTNLCTHDSLRAYGPAGFMQYLWNKKASTQNELTIYQAGTWLLTVIDSNGCKSPESKAVKVTQTKVPQPQFEYSGKTQFCQGDSVLIEVSTPYDQYEWIGENGGASIVVKQTDRLLFRGWVGDCPTDTQYITTTMHPRPITPTLLIDTVDKTDCQLNYRLHTSIDGIRYQWLGTELASSYIETNKAGEYALRYQDANDCWSGWSDTLSIAILQSQIFAESILDLYPNPTDDRVHISTRSAIYSQAELNLKVVDLMGRTLYTEPVGSIDCATLSLEINIIQLSVGCYTVVIESADGQILQKLVIAR